MKTLKIIQTRINGHVGRKQFDVFESEMTARVEKMAADLTGVKNSSMNQNSADNQSDNISRVLARTEDYAKVINSTR